MVWTELHPHPVSRWAKLTVVAVDLGRVRTGYVPGAEDVQELESRGGTAPPKGFSAGLVPNGLHDSLLAVFNGGFKPRHGRWGMRAEHLTLLPLRDGGCTVAIDDAGLVSVGPWPALRARESEFVAFRQTPPCLVLDGKLHPLLEARNERPWAGFDPKRKTRRRSAVGVDATGRVLFYGIGEEMEPRVLALGMSYVGAVNAAELDINWSWTRFLLFGTTDQDTELHVTSTLIPQMVHRQHGYVHDAAARGFFFLADRAQAARGRAKSPSATE